MTDAMKNAKATAARILTDWKEHRYEFGPGCLPRVGAATAELAGEALIVANESEWLAEAVETVATSLGDAGVRIAGRIRGARPNSPREDVYRIQDAIAAAGVGAVVAVGGGSTIDAAKAANVLAALSGRAHDIEPYFGVGKVTEALRDGGMLPAFVAVQCAAGSGAHLTKYSNITDVATAQKKLIIDPAIVPARAVFDYAVTVTAGRDLTLDGAFDGLGHIIEAYCGARPETIDELEAAAMAGVELIVSSVGRAVEAPDDLDAREAIGLGTDLGGYAIMVGSTNGAHLNSFSMVDVLAHGRAVAVLEPYYAVLFAPAIERQLRTLGTIYARHGFIDEDLSVLDGRELGVAVAEGMMALSRKVGFPTTLGGVPGFTDRHVARALAGAKDPALASKLAAMPVPMSAGQVDEYMGSVLAAARTGELGLVKCMT